MTWIADDDQRDLYCICRVRDVLLALPVEVVRESVRLGTVCGLAGAPPAVTGLMNLRSRILLVLEARSLLGLPADPVDDPRVIVTQCDGEDVGLLVDEVLHVAGLDGSPAPLPKTALPGVDHECLRGALLLGDRPVIVLDLPRLVAADNIWSQGHATV